MKIRYLGHSSFLITSGAGVAVVTDPYAPEVGFKMPKVSADIVTVSHRHYDHDNVKAVDGSPVILEKEPQLSICGIDIRSVGCFHDDAGGKKRGENRIFKFRIDGINVCHLGDLGEPCSDGLIEKIKPVDVLMIPVGGNYTIDARTAKEYVEKLLPKVVIPMHYRVSGGKVDIDGVDGFLKLFSGVIIEIPEKSEIELSASDLGGEQRIKVLRRA